MAEFVGGKSVVVDVGEPITFENKTDADFNVSYGVVFRKSGLYRVSVNGKHTSITIEPERKMGKWIRHYSRPNVYADLCWHCSNCGYKTPDNWANKWKFCPDCGARMQEGEQL